MAVIEMEPVHVLDDTTKERVLECGRRIRSNKTPLRKVCMEIGWDGAYIESLAEQGSWRVLGYENQHNFRVAEGISYSNWYRHLAIAKNFLKLDRETYLGMSIDNAERLGVEPEEVRLNPENIRAASEMKSKEFRDRMATVNAHEAGRPVKEKWAEIKWRLREEQCKVIQSGLKSWMEEHGIEGEAYALELMVAEYTDRPTLVGFMLEAVPKLTQAVKDTDDISELKLLLVSHIQEIGSILKQCCGEEEEVA